MKITGNEPAFPNSIVVGPGDHAYYDGMTLRQYFAGQALAGLCAANLKYGDNERMRDIDNHELADYAVILTDHLIARLNREK